MHDDEVTEITVKTSDRRRHPRFERRLVTMVYTLTASYRTTTLNISESGVLLQDDLPKEFCQVPLEVMIIEERDGQFPQFFLFKARAVTDHPRSACRLEFTWTPVQTLTPFRGFLAEIATGTNDPAGTA